MNPTPNTAGTDDSDLLPLLAGLAVARPGDLKPIMNRLVERYSHEVVNIALLGQAATGERPDPFTRGLVSAAKLPQGQKPARLWFGLYPASVVLLIGETGAGKSSLLYNIAIQAARNGDLYDVPFGMGRSLNVLYLDPENAGVWEEGRGGVCALRLDRIQEGKPESLFFHDGRGVNLSDSAHVAYLRERIIAQRVDLLILDPIANLFGTEDENDNAEAAKQMKALVALSRETNACIIACHHTGKDNTGNYGRGASARLAAADVGLVFRVRSGSDDVDDDFTGETRQRDDVCRLQIVKNRLEGRASLFLRMAGDDRFERVDFQAWQGTGSGKSRNKSQQARDEIELLFADGNTHRRAEIVNAMKAEKIGQKATDAALALLYEEGRVEINIGPNNAKAYRRKDEQAGSAVFQNSTEDAKLRNEEAGE